jgi:hypothetical protein
MNTTKQPVSNQVKQLWEAFTRLRVVLFVIVLVLLYGFISWRIQVLSSVEPDATAIASQAKATAQPKIDQALVDKITQLQDTNVTVKALFDQARKNPFRE